MENDKCVSERESECVTARKMAVWRVCLLKHSLCSSNPFHLLLFLHYYNKTEALRVKTTYVSKQNTPRVWVLGIKQGVEVK